MAETTDHEINRLIQDVVEAAKLPPRARQIDIKPTVADLISLGHDRGFLPDALESMIDVLTVPSHLDQASLSSIARNLYPATAPSRMVVLRVVSCLGHGQRKPSLNIQAALVRWLILVYPTLQSPSTLSQCYQVLFQLLDTAAFRSVFSLLTSAAWHNLIMKQAPSKPIAGFDHAPQTCQTFQDPGLVSPYSLAHSSGSILTLRRLSLSRQSGSDPCLVGLLRVFKDYYPEIIVGEAVRGKASAFKVSAYGLDCNGRIAKLNSIPTPNGVSVLTRFRKLMPFERWMDSPRFVMASVFTDRSIAFAGIN